MPSFATGSTNRTSSQVLLHTFDYIGIASNRGCCGVNYQEMCSEWNNIVVAEMKDIQDVAGSMHT